MPESVDVHRLATAIYSAILDAQARTRGDHVLYALQGQLARALGQAAPDPILAQAFAPFDMMPAEDPAPLGPESPTLWDACLYAIGPYQAVLSGNEIAATLRALADAVEREPDVLDAVAEESGRKGIGVASA